MRTIILITTFLLVRLPCFAQEYNYVHYDKKDGLAGPVVYHMAQDRDGFIWFATETGLSRFDGTQFKNFTVKDGLPDNEIIRLFVDSKNRLWIMTFSASLCYYQNGYIHNNKNDSLVSRLKVTSFVKIIHENDKGELAIVEDGKILIVKENGSVISFDNYRGNYFQVACASGVKDKSKFEFSMASKGILYRLELCGDSLHMLFTSSLPRTATYPIYISNDLEIYSSDLEYLIKGKSDHGPFSFRSDGFLNVQRLNDSLIVICWSTKVEIYNFYRKKTERIIYNGKNVNFFLEDSEGSWWFSNLGSGVDRLPSTQIKNYFIQDGNYFRSVTSLEKYNDTLYVGADRYRVYKINLGTAAITYQTVTEGRSPGRIITLDRMRNGILMAGTETGLYAVRPGGKSFERLPSSAIKSSQMHGDSLLYGSSWSTHMLDTRTMKLVDTLQSGRNTGVSKLGENTYIGTLNGLFVYDRNKKPRYLGHLHRALAGKISTIRVAPNGIIWVGTYGYGIVGLQNGKVITVIDKDSGLTSNICRSMYIKEDVLWIGTDEGLNKVQFNGKRCIIKNFTIADGLPSDIINTILQDGKTVYIGTPAGVSYFDEDKVRTSSICHLKITGIQSPIQQWYNDTSGLRFEHYENDIRIEFAGISFKSGKEITYRYKLSGLDGIWRETRDNFLNFLSLPSGNYDLEIVAINKFGVSSQTRHMRFSIAKMFWEETWFKISVAVLAALMIWLFVRYRTQKIRREAAFKIETSRKITELEQMALKAQMNPHFIFNSLQSIQQYVIDNDVMGANKYITDFARLIRLTLDISAQPKISLADETSYISTYLALEKAKFEGKFDYRVETSEDIEPNSYYIPALLLQPFVENSIRHGIYHRTDNLGMISIDFKLENEYLVCSIEDNGVGRKASEKLKSGKPAHQSKGMSITAKRIDMLNRNYTMPIYTNIEDVYNAVNEISGTRVVLRFPLQEVKKRV